MTTPTSGQISMSQLRTVFGASGQVSMSDFYSNSTYTPDTVTGAGGAVPSSGALAMSKFYSPLHGTMTGYFQSGDDTGAEFTGEANFLDGNDSTYMTFPLTDGFYGILNLANYSRRTEFPAGSTITNLRVVGRGRARTSSGLGVVDWIFYPNRHADASFLDGAFGTGSGGVEEVVIGDGPPVATWAVSAANVLAALTTTSTATNYATFRTYGTTNPAMLDPQEAYELKVTPTFLYA